MQRERGGVSTVKLGAGVLKKKEKRVIAKKKKDKECKRKTRKKNYKN